MLGILFPYKGYKIFAEKVENERILLGLKSRRLCGICPSCGKRCRNVETEYERTVRDLDLAGKPCYIEFKQKKIRCKCGYRGLEKLDFVAKSRRVTKRMEAYVVSLCEKMSLKDVARVTGLNWKTVRVIDKEFVKSLLPDINNLEIRRIAIDEIAVMKGHKYVTIIRDYDSGVVLKIFFGRKYVDTKKALNELGEKRLCKIEFSSLDMWDPYIKAIRECCQNVKLVFDKFHVVKKVNEALDKVRKNEFANAKPEEKKKMKHKRWIILKRTKNLKSTQKEDLNTLMNSNNYLFKAYILKEQILSIFEDTESNFEKIENRLYSWMENILSNSMEEFYGVMNTIRDHLEGVLNYFRYGMTNAIAEGFNTKINILKRRAFGFRDIEYFMLKIVQQSLRRVA
jgi:transposase